MYSNHLHLMHSVSLSASSSRGLALSSQQLVTSLMPCGAPVPPHCRVVYQAEEASSQVWVQLSDGSCRWRQSAGEVEVQALRVPRGLASGQLVVELQLYSILGELTGLCTLQAAGLDRVTTCWVHVAVAHQLHPTAQCHSDSQWLHPVIGH